MYGKDNVARVRRDEENARKEAAELQRRADIAAAEHRVDILRQRARNGARTGSHDQQTAVGPDPTQAGKSSSELPRCACGPVNILLAKAHAMRGGRR